MAKVINALDLVRNKKRLPTEAFFVDTNIMIGFVDPFSRSISDPVRQTLNENLTEVIKALKSQGIKGYTTTSVALEYYKYIQTGFYKIEISKNRLDVEDFKRLRDTNVDFIVRWDNQLKVFKRNFSKAFPLFDIALSSMEAATDFEGSKVDFGDHLLFKAVTSIEERLRCIFTNDADFLAYPDDFYLLTTNMRIIGASQQRIQ
jgi:hypothetical protein